MKLRKANSNSPIINNQEDDKTIVDGYMTPGEIVERGKLAAVNTIETLKKMYPHSPEIKARESEMIMDKEINKQLRRIENENRENISAYYQKHAIKDRIMSIKNEIDTLNKGYEESKHTNLIYEKERKIKELEKIIEETKKAIK